METAGSHALAKIVRSFNIPLRLDVDTNLSSGIVLCSFEHRITVSPASFCVLYSIRSLGGAFACFQQVNHFLSARSIVLRTSWI